MFDENMNIKWECYFLLVELLNKICNSEVCLLAGPYANILSSVLALF